MKYTQQAGSNYRILSQVLGTIVAASIFLATGGAQGELARPHRAAIRSGGPSNQLYSSSNGSIDVGQIFKLQVEPTCYDGSGNPLNDTVTISVVSGVPDTGNARTTFNPNPVATFATSEMKIVTTTATEAGSYEPTITGNGPVCGQYTDYSFPLTLNPIISLSRQDLLTIVATGLSTTGSDGSTGSFAFQTQDLTGDSFPSIGFANGNNATTNPNTAVLADPDNPDENGAPSPGGIASMTVNYTVAGLTAANDKSNPFHAAAFGMSCYYTALQSDWGTAPNKCKSISIHGTTYSGFVKDPNGLAGKYCSSFIAEVKLQGSAVLNNEEDIQYDPDTNLISVVSQITGHDGTAVVAGQTVARDLRVIPETGVHVAINNVGSGLLANDTGGAIKGYRLDLYNGAGKGVCAGYSNPIAVTTCDPEQSKGKNVMCPGSALQ